MTKFAIDWDALESLRSDVRAFAENSLTGFIDAIDQPTGLPEPAYRLLADAGYLGITLPPAYGGAGLSFAEYCVVLEEFSRISSAFALWVTMSSGPVQAAILKAGNKAQRQTLLPAVARGECRMAFALTEPDAGSDAAAIRTRAEPVAGGGWRINGRKHYITLGDVADWVLVIALTDPEKRARGGISAFLVPTTAPGFSIGRIEVTIGNEQIVELGFDDCLVSEEALIGGLGGGFAVAMDSLDEGRLGVAISCIGAASKALELMTDYARTRSTFGEPLAARQAVQWMIADSVVEIESCRALFEKALTRMAEGQPVTQLASMCKLAASEMVGRVTDRAMQVHGGAGLIRSGGVERLYRETRHYRVGEGASEVQRMIIARAALKG
ncbi:MAG: acyl-CoA dehydrogenase family protein [Sphingobium sp.]|uniref:acyl-CoA dehydrogenase family protein n=1 Tax=Sphingobium sp. TaxID=1912891 RepID=UPI002E1BE519